MEWYLWQVYLWGCIPAWPLSAYAIAHYFHKEEGGEIGTEGLVLSVLGGICVNWFWPLFLPGYWIWEWLHTKFGSEG